VCDSDNSEMIYVENFKFFTFKNYKMNSINDGDVLFFFANDSRNASQPLSF
jgi:hypothetical protein